MKNPGRLSEVDYNTHNKCFIKSNRGYVHAVADECSTDRKFLRLGLGVSFIRNHLNRTKLRLQGGLLGLIFAG